MYIKVIFDNHVMSSLYIADVIYCCQLYSPVFTVLLVFNILEPVIYHKTSYKLTTLSLTAVVN